jgi:hypothetical protein
MKIIDKELNMWSCQPEELDCRQMKLLTRGLPEWDTPFTFESFFDDLMGKFTVNENCFDFDDKITMYTLYLKATPEKRADFKEKHSDDDEIFEYLDIIQSKIENSKFCDLLSKQPHHFELYSTFENVRLTLGCSYNSTYFYNMIYNYGVMQGKRAERAKRKKALAKE